MRAASPTNSPLSAMGAAWVTEAPLPATPPDWKAEAPAPGPAESVSASQMGMGLSVESVDVPVRNVFDGYLPNTMDTDAKTRPEQEHEDPYVVFRRQMGSNILEL